MTTSVLRWTGGSAGNTGRPGFHARRATGSGSFLAASGVQTIRYDGHRRLRLPYIGSVKLRHGLPDEAVVSKVTVKKVNGRWYASLSLRVAGQGTGAEGSTVLAVSMWASVRLLWSLTGRSTRTRGL